MLVMAKQRSSPADPSVPEKSTRRFSAWPAVLLAVITLALYWPATRYGFVNYDDEAYVAMNVHVQKGLTSESVQWALRNPVTGNWHPVTMLSHMLDCQLYGLKPSGHHLTNILLHALNTALVFVLLRRMTGAMWASLFVAAFFGLHPLRVESVAWIAERKDVLSGCFGLLSLLFYVRYAQRRLASEPAELQNRSARWSAGFDFGLALFFLALGLMSKAMLVTWPFVMLLLDYWPLQRFNARGFWPLIREKIPFFALITASSVVTLLTQKGEGAMDMVNHLSFSARFENALVSYFRYLGKMVWPSNFAVLYPHPGHWPIADVLVAGVLLVCITGFFWTLRRAHPFLLIGWLWYCGTLVPVIGLIQVGEQSMADRYTYLPSIGILILIIWSARELLSRRHALAAPLFAAGFVGIVVSAVWTRDDLGYWRDSETLFRQTLKATTNNPSAHNNLGAALCDKGQLDEAIVEFREAIRLKPDYAKGHNNLATALANKGQNDEAIFQYQEALRCKPEIQEVTEIDHMLGMLLCKKGDLDQAIPLLQEAVRFKPWDAGIHNDLGNAFDGKGRTDEAISHYQEAVRLKPDGPEAHSNLGAAWARKGNLDAAIQELQLASRLNPNDGLAHYNLGMACHDSGRTDESILHLQEAIRLKVDTAELHHVLGIELGRKGDRDGAMLQLRKAISLNAADATLHNDLGNVLDANGQSDEALREYEQAIRLKPDDAEAHGNLGAALGKKGNVDGAIRELQEALRLNPNDAMTHYNLGMALNDQGRTNEAILHLKEAVRLKPDFTEARSQMSALLPKNAAANP
jgi:tetratricopeptide (TPR) repeat protein